MQFILPIPGMLHEDGGVSYCRSTDCCCPEHGTQTPHRQCGACAALYGVLYKRIRRFSSSANAVAQQDTNFRTSLLKCNQKIDELEHELDQQRQHHAVRGSLNDEAWQVVRNLVSGMQKTDGTPAQFQEGIMFALIRNAAEILSSMFAHVFISV